MGQASSTSTIRPQPCARRWWSGKQSTDSVTTGTSPALTFCLTARKPTALGLPTSARRPLVSRPACPAICATGTSGGEYCCCNETTTHGFNSAHAAWLEGRLHDLIGASALGSLSNQQRPGDDTLAPYDRLMLETTIDPISRVLRLIGYETAPPDDETATQTRGRRTPMRYTTTLADLLTSGLLAPGTRLVSTYASYAADAVVNADGSITWDGQTFATPSAAGCAVRAGKATNGWSFWAVQTDNGKVTLATLRARHAAAAV